MVSMASTTAFHAVSLGSSPDRRSILRGGLEWFPAHPHKVSDIGSTPILAFISSKVITPS